MKQWMTALGLPVSSSHLLVALPFKEVKLLKEKKENLSFKLYNVFEDIKVYHGLQFQ